MNAPDTPSQMEPVCKRAKASHNSDDRISNLSDSILHHILSFLSVGEVVRTSVLSPRWRRLWATMPSVTINGEEYHGYDDIARERNACENFEDFMYNFLFLRDSSCLDMFRLSIDESVDYTDQSVRTWIRHVLKCNPRVLKICSLVHEHLDLHNLVFSAASRLKTLKLAGVALDRNFMKYLNSGCPVLEELKLECSCFEFSEISSRSLKTLKVVSCTHEDELVISIPCLRNLKLFQPILGSTKLKNMSSLVKASICFENISENDDDSIVRYAILDGLTNATSLELLGVEPTVTLEKDLPACLMFNNLKDLTFGEWCMGADSYPVVCFLQRSPNLEKLHLQLAQEREIADQMQAIYKPSKESFSCEHLKMVHIRCVERDTRTKKFEMMLHTNAQCPEIFTVEKKFWMKVDPAGIVMV